MLAKACEDAHLRAAMLRESLTLLSRVTHKLNLSAVCLEYQTGEGWGMLYWALLNQRTGVTQLNSTHGMHSNTVKHGATLN